jgi:hypothetical protein
MVLSVPRCAGISKSRVGKPIVQESDLMIRLFKSCGLETMNRYFTPWGWISPAFWISEFAKPSIRDEEKEDGTAVRAGEGHDNDFSEERYLGKE